MSFAYPELWGLTLLAALTGLLAVTALVRRWRGRRKLLQGPHPAGLWSVSPGAQVLKTAAVAVAAVLLGLAVLGPQWGRVAEDTGPTAGRDLFVVLDVSRSMLAQDVAPSRLERVRADLLDLAAAQQQCPERRLGLVLFADRAALVCPLTLDCQCFADEVRRASLEGLRVRSEREADDGTQIAAALWRVASVVKPDRAAFTDVLLLSDGGDLGQDTLAAAERLARLGITVHALGVGDPGRPSLIPIADAPGGERYLTFQGQPVSTRLEADILRQIATRTGGTYAVLPRGTGDLSDFLAAAAATRPQRELAAGGKTQVLVPRYAWFVLPALALLLSDMVLSDRRRRGVPESLRPFYFMTLRRRRSFHAQGERKQP